MQITVNEIIYTVSAMLFAALMAFTSTPISMVFAHKIGAIDIPKDNRRMHNRPIPRIGGISIYFAFAFSALLFCEHSKTLFTILIGGFILALVGVFDDVKDLPAWIKLLVQIAVAGLAVFNGFRIQFINISGDYLPLPLWLSVLVSMAWIIGMTNAINLIDGLDGLSCGVSIIGSLSLLFVMLTRNPIPSSAIIIALLAASCLGFLPYNFYPAKTFMGDTGALFLGYTMAVLSIDGVFKWHAVISFVIPIAIFGYPLFETVFSFFRRIYNKKNPFKGDKEHIHHRLINLGFNQKQSVGILYAISGILSLSAVMFTNTKLIQASAMLLAAVVIFIIELKIIKNPVTRIQGGFHLKDCNGKASEQKPPVNESESVSSESSVSQIDENEDLAINKSKPEGSDDGRERE